MYMYIPFTGREINDLHSIMAEPGLTLKLGPAPQSHALSVHGGQVGPMGRPADIRVSPVLQSHMHTQSATKHNKII